MRIPKYWAKATHQARDKNGSNLNFSCWRGSAISEGEARSKAEQSARKIAEALVRKEHLNRYDYATRDLREEIKKEILDSKGNVLAIITRNSYGSLVLNTANVLFFDIDLNLSATRNPNLLSALKRKLFGSAQNDKLLESTERIRSWAKATGESLRLYETHNGLRGLVTSRTYDPKSSEVLDLLKQFNSDPLYIKLCRAQECFRARLSPKPWRCGLSQPPSSYPWESLEKERSYRAWEESFEQESKQYAICRLIDSLGPIAKTRRASEELEQVIDIHDSYCLSTSAQLA